jgi:predicted ABC-type transport system involved in lysophospholipase L1 biosynthesis ATPase subunit
MTAPVQLTDVRKVYGTGPGAVDALAGVTYGFAAGSFTAVMGPSGSGKSTLLHCAAGLDTPTSGNVQLAGQSLRGLDETTLTGLRLGDDALVKVKVVALTEGPSGYESLLLPAQLLAAHTTTCLPSQLVLKTTDKKAALKTDLSEWPGTAIGGRALLADGLDTGLGVDAWIGYLLAAIAVAYTAIASINTIAVAVLGTGGASSGCSG